MQISDINSKFDSIKKGNLQLATGTAIFSAVNFISDLSKNEINVKDVFQYKNLNEIQKRRIKTSGINGICSAVFFGFFAKMLCSKKSDNNIPDTKDEQTKKQKCLKSVALSTLFGVFTAVGKVYSSNFNLKDVLKYKNLNISQKSLMKYAGLTGIENTLLLLLLNYIRSENKLNSDGKDKVNKQILV